MGMENVISTLKTLDNIIGISGDEAEVALALKSEMEGLYDEYFEDVLGNQYFIKYGKNRDKKLVFAAHMDEIGFIINRIEKNGICRFLPIGHHDAKNVVNQEMTIICDGEKKITGVTGAKPVHLISDSNSQSALSIEDLFVDLGTFSEKETRALGVSEGSLMTYNRKGTLLNGSTIYSGKSVDDRAGLTAIIEAMKTLKDEVLENTVIAVGTCQEEVGMKSGGPVANRLNPEVFIAVDVSFAGGIPGYSDEEAVCIMGNGPVVTYYDWNPDTGVGNIVPRKLINKIEQIAGKHNISLQKEICLNGGTDAATAAIANRGCLAGIIGIPERYMHTAVGTVDLNDIKSTAKLIAAFAKEY